MIWHDLLFLHWAVDPASLRPHVPSRLQIETFPDSGGAERAWLAVVPFWMSGVRAAALPPVPGTSRFPELNVRTYVRAPRDGADRPGVYFFTLDAASAVAVWGAQRFFHLNYRRARMTVERQPAVGAGEHWVDYASRRTHRGYPSAEFRARYRPLGEPFTGPAGSLLKFVTDRYCLYAADRRERLFRCEIHHDPWLLQRAEAAIEVNSMAALLGLDPAGDESRNAGILHYARRQDVVAWMPERVS
jgi:uncharacterized protein YqjF (DUF2071 family)